MSNFDVPRTNAVHVVKPMVSSSSLLFYNAARSRVFVNSQHFFLLTEHASLETILLMIFRPRGPISEKTFPNMGSILYDQRMLEALNNTIL